MNLRLLLLLCLLLTGAVAHAQQDGPASQANLAALTAGAPTVLPRGSIDGLKGSPYADSRWLQGRLTLNNNLPLAPLPLKYDVLGSRLLMRTVERPKDSLQLDDRRVVSFVLQEPASAQGPARQRLFRRFVESPSPEHKTDFVEVLHEGRYSLLKHYVKALKKADFGGAYSSDRRYDEIEDHSVYYLRTPDAALVPIKLNPKAMQAAAPGLASQLKTALATQKPKSEADWSAVLNAADPAPAR
ncbi:MAG: hypothetical protein JWR44_1007 [Hymenobacter sp.]|jgi:hypothetical protein|nr:hypothetical protein [Hymenobacter sp.]